MADVECLYRNAAECRKCKGVCVFLTKISMSYSCLNGDEHDFKETITFPPYAARLQCTICGENKALSENQ